MNPDALGSGHPASHESERQVKRFPEIPGGLNPCAPDTVHQRVHHRDREELTFQYHQGLHDDREESAVVILNSAAPSMSTATATSEDPIKVLLTVRHQC
jgi:hypothetical protein